MSQSTTGPSTTENLHATGPLPPQPAAPVVLMFAGQGAQYPRMAAGLYEHDAVFTEWMDEALGLLGASGTLLRRRWLAATPGPDFDDVTVAQPLLFALNHALAQMVLSWGVTPVALLGHSVGEFAAATVAGVFDLAEAMRLMQDRMVHFTGTVAGGMLAVAARESDIGELLAGEKVWLAAENAPRQLLLGGESADLARAAQWLDERGIICRSVASRQAFHTPLVADAVRASLPAFRATTLRPPALPLYSAYTGALLADDTACDPEFWAWQAARTVRFGATLTAVLQAHPHCTLLEAGPGDSLTRLARRQPAFRSRGITALSLLETRSDEGSDGDRTERSMVFQARLTIRRQPLPTTARQR